MSTNREEPASSPSGGAEPKLPILYSDPWILAVDKPPGLPCHPLSQEELREEGSASVSAIVMSRHPETALKPPAGAPEELSRRLALQGGMLHRLDNASSGVLLFARSLEAWEALAPIIQGRGAGARKYYLARCAGGGTNPAGTEISYPIAHSRRRGSGRMIAVRENTPPQRFRGRPRPALTRILATRELDGGELLVLAAISRGQRHQIRCHLAASGHYLIGDSMYAPQSTPGGEFFLHHWKIVFYHPLTGGEVSISSAPPASKADPRVLSSWAKLVG
jgi:23S rRNA-/tRNA-specific pseudouridylate synthase